MKLFHVMTRIGHAKYVVNYHDGIKTHKDGSPFYAIAIFKNKKKLHDFVCELVKEGYRER